MCDVHVSVGGSFLCSGVGRLLPRICVFVSLLQYKHEVGSLQQKLSGLTREELQRALGVKPMDKSSRSGGGCISAQQHSLRSVEIKLSAYSCQL